MTTLLSDILVVEGRGLEGDRGGRNPLLYSSNGAVVLLPRLRAMTGRIEATSTPSERAPELYDSVRPSEPAMRNMIAHKAAVTRFLCVAKH